MKIDLCTGNTHMNKDGVLYYSAENENGHRVYSFTLDFEDIWTQDDEDAIKADSAPSKI